MLNDHNIKLYEINMLTKIGGVEGSSKELIYMINGRGGTENSDIFEKKGWRVCLKKKKPDLHNVIIEEKLIILVIGLVSFDQ